MRRFLALSLVIFAFAVATPVARAQVFYSQNFAGGFPTGWTTDDTSPNNVLWEYCSGPAAACANLYGEADFASTSAANGFMLLDSDGAGQLTSPHTSILTSAAINCSAQSQVYAVFENYIGVFNTASDGTVLFKVSTDLTNWTSFNFLPPIASDDFSANPFVASIDISAVAANKPQVYLRWEWTGNYEYWWHLDDVKLTSQNPEPANDLIMGDFFYPASSFGTPQSQIATDTFGFYAEVSNDGTDEQYVVTLKVEVFRDSDDELLFTDSASIASLEPGYVDSVIYLPNRFVPENLEIGYYNIVYTVYSDATDERPADNTAGDQFAVTDNLFSKEDGPTGALRPGDGGDYAAANIYQMAPGTLENYQAVGYQFTAATNPAPDPALADVSVQAYLFKVIDDVLPDWSNFSSVGDLFSTSLEWVGEGNFDFPTGAMNYVLQPVILTDIGTGLEGVPLEAGARYFATIGYTDNNNVAFQAFSDETSHYFVSSAVHTALPTARWFLGGFGEDYNPVIRMIIDLVTTIDETPLPESAMKVYPNPVKDVLNLEVNFETATDATITIAEMSGRVINIDNREGLTNEVLSYQVPQLAPGTYLARIATEQGTKTKKFVVVK